jgi:hypothetical protein
MLIQDLSKELDAETMTAVRGGDNSHINVSPVPLVPAWVKPTQIGSIWNVFGRLPAINSPLNPTPEVFDPNNPLLQ